MENNILKNWKLWCIVIIIMLILGFFYIFNSNSKNIKLNNEKQYKLGDIINLNEEDKEILRNKTINHIKNNLKAPSTAKFEEKFRYICNEENIIKVEGYVDSQNSFGAMIRGNFSCEYFAINKTIDILVYLKYNDTEILNIKEQYLKEYKKQEKLDNIKSSGNELNQEKLDYIMNEFNTNEINDVGRITNVLFSENQSNIDVQITATTEIGNNYWINYNICSIMDYIKEFNVVGVVKIKLVDKGKIVEIVFDNEFVKNKWKGNQQINLVKEIFGENYKEL